MTDHRPSKNPAVRQAQCGCGQLLATCTGEPLRVSICHCSRCRRRTGSAFSWNATFAEDAVRVEGQRGAFQRSTDSGRTNTYYFCPACGSTVFYRAEMRPGTVSIPAGAFGAMDDLSPTVELFLANVPDGARSMPARDWP